MLLLNSANMAMCRKRFSLFRQPNNSLLRLIACFIYIILWSEEVKADCTAGSYDLQLIKNWNPWSIKAQLVPNEWSLIHISICDNTRSTVAGSKCSSEESSICLKQGDIHTNLGDFNATALNYTLSENGDGFRLDYKGDDCPDSKEGKPEKIQTSISFKCGTTLGSPVFIGKLGCTYFFEWHSTVACKDANPDVNEVKCYLYDNKNQKRDLSPLVKTSGGYLVNSDSGDDLYINVCRDITPSGPTANCPAGAAACLITSGSQGDNMGKATDHELYWLNEQHLQIRYEGETSPASCNGFKPRVTISFVCPKDEGRMSGGRDPLLLSSTNCQYDIEWQTEYACDAAMLTSKECHFNNDIHGVDIDLSDLKLSQSGHPEKPYKAEDKARNDLYFLNVCEDLPNGCGSGGTSSPAAVCQAHDISNPSNEKVAGLKADMELRYADGELTLTYKGGEVCNHNGFARTSIITFECNKTAPDDGNGIPEFVGETECTYFFEWQTKYACSEHPAETSCTLAQGGKRFDLSPLVRTSGDNWQALDGRHEHDSPEHGQYFVNICSDILIESRATSNCPPGSAVCFISDDQSQGNLNLGQYTKTPEFNEDGRITLTYTDGDVCVTTPEKKRSTIIMFICAPGDLESAPSLVRKSEDSCLYEFEWRTAAACPLGKKIGTDCKVFDDDAGFSFDLNPLKKTTGSYKYSNENSTYDFFLNVCDKVTGEEVSCDQSNNPGACQQQKEGDGKWNLGQANSTLEYYDGLLKLTYLNGDPYHTPVGQKKKFRKTEIAFLCDNTDNDIGSPVYQKEANDSYLFTWHTKYACPEQPIECIVTDERTHEQYDLSSLSKALEEENWSFVDDATDPSVRSKYYINVCRPINPVKGCGSYASVCKATFNNNEETISVPNLGVAKSRPVVESSGHIMLKYVEGSACSDGPKTQVESHIHFSCRRGKLGSSPRLLEKVSDCVYSFIWETEAACPIETSMGEDCVVKDTNSEYWFNLQPLMKPDGYYDVQTPDAKQFQLNICKAIGTSSSCPENTSACLIEGNSAKSVGSVNNKPEFSDDGLLTLKYNGPVDVDTNIEITSEITFLCRHNIPQADQKPEFVRKEDYNYIFNFETPLACLPESVDCLVSDMHGNQYDLSPLAKDSGNWEAVDTRDGYEHLSYHINVCRPVNALTSEDGETSEAIQCPGGPIGACQTDSTSKTSYNTGYVQAMPEAGTDGSLSIRYVNGDKCHKGKYHRSTRINFECSSTPGSPVFQEETLECEYIFTWQTPAACPMKRVTGKNCAVQVQQYDFQFDLSSLHNTAQDYVVETDKYDYQINVCGPLVGGTGECDGGDKVAACQKNKAGEPVAQAGVVNQDLVYNEGVLTLNYTDGKTCHTVYQRSTAINFFCDDTIHDNGKPTFMNETEDCTYVFEWPTPLACPPFKVVECSYRNSSQQYDLAPLAGVEDNYKVISNSGVERGTFYINMCRSLLHKKGVKGEACPHNSAACLETTENGKKKYLNLGEVSTGPVMENSHLVIRYLGGDTCSDGVKKRSTEISIECDKNGVGGLPQFSYASDECTYYFTWFSNLACDIANDNEAVNEDCTATNPATGHIFDLTSLKKEGGYVVKGNDNHKYTINICDKLTGSKCDDDGVGSCQEQMASLNPHHYNAGHYNRRLKYDDGILSLTYKDGASCHNDQFKRSTVINFVCPLVEDSIGEPVFIDESDDCTYFLSWHTSLVCEHFIQCSVTNGSQTIDLSPLVNSQGYFLATSLTTTAPFYINLCHPLNPIPGIRCPPGAAACKVLDDGPISLGKVAQGPQIVDDTVTITYTNGDKCDADKSRNLTSIVKLQCAKGLSTSSPVMTSYADCTYNFVWETNAVCPPSKSTEGKDCKYYNDVLDYEFDLSSLTGKTYTTMVPGSGAYMVHLCGSVGKDKGDCSDAAVCKKEDTNYKSLGSVTSQEFSFEGHMLKVTYTNGSPCLHDESDKRQTTILFKCSEDGKEEDPAFFSVDRNCHYTFQWSTSLACPPMTMPCDLSYHGNIFDLQPLSQITGSWQFQDSNKNTYYMNLCQPAYNTPDGCPKEAAMCRQRPDADSTVDVLGMVYTQQLRAYGDTSRPDIIMKLSDGSPYACAAETSEEVTSTEVQIIFMCANKVGTPEYYNTTITPQKACRLTFLWKSKVACPEQRIEVKEKNGKIQDTDTDKIIDLNPLMDPGTWLVEGDEREEKSGSHSSYRYYINLGTKASEIDGDTSNKCKKAAVCQTKTDGSFYRGLGNINSKKFYIEKEILEIEITSPESCGQKDTRDVISTVVLQCDPNGKLGEPKFLYESSNCQYYFEWVTSAACDSVTAVNPNSPGKGSGGGGGGEKVKHSEVSTVIGVLLGIVVLCVLVIVFHKKERRSAVYWKIRSCFPGAYSNVPAYSYAQLSSGDSEENLIGLNSTRGLFSDDEEEDEELLKDTRTNPHEFHDDSDEEILPNV